MSFDLYICQKNKQKGKNITSPAQKSSFFTIICKYFSYQMIVHCTVEYLGKLPPVQKSSCLIKLDQSLCISWAQQSNGVNSRAHSNNSGCPWGLHCHRILLAKYQHCPPLGEVRSSRYPSCARWRHFGPSRWWTASPYWRGSRRAWVRCKCEIDGTILAHHPTQRKNKQKLDSTANSLQFSVLLARLTQQAPPHII